MAWFVCGNRGSNGVVFNCSFAHACASSVHEHHARASRIALTPPNHPSLSPLASSRVVSRAPRTPSSPPASPPPPRPSTPRGAFVRQSPPITHARARAHHHRSHRARLPRSNARRPIPPLSRVRDLRRSPRPSSHPSRARLPRVHPSVASSRAHLHHRLHRVRSHRLFARHRPSSAARRGRGRGRGSSTRSVGRSRSRSRFFRVSFACLSRSVVYTPPSVYTPCFIFV